ncbi:MAG: imidazolonepropionase, partial [Desulfobacteraceae bacterium]
MKSEADLVVKGAGQLLTMVPGGSGVTPEEKLGLIQGGSLAVRGGAIVWAGPDRELDGNVVLSAGGLELDGRGKVVTPGFIDSHTHPIFAGSRAREFELRIQGATYQQIAQAGGGIKSTVENTRAASKEELRDLGLGRLDEMLSLGTTTVEAKSGYGLSVADEIKMLEVIRELDRVHPMEVVSTFLGAHEIPPEYAGRKRDYVRLVIEEMIPEVASKKLASFCDVFCEEGVFSLEESRRILEKGAEYGLLPKLHADELTPLGGAELAAELGAVSADHLLYASDKGMEMMARKGVVATLLPGTAFFLFMGRYAPAKVMKEKGVTIALATDFNPGSCMTQSLPLITTIACTQMRMTPAECILGITMNAARAIGREESLGSL